MKLEDIRTGDLVYYRNGKTNIVKRPNQYKKWYSKDLKNLSVKDHYDIMMIKRYKKILCFYILKTIYKRQKSQK